MNQFKSISLSKCLMHSFFLIMLIGNTNAAYAGGMKIKVGLWEMKSTVTLPFGNGTQEDVAQNCIQDDEVTPDQIMQEAQGCKITDAKSDSGSMQWSLVCQNQGVEMKGEGFAKSTGDTLSGEMNIKFDLEGQELAMTSIYEGKYIGPCK